MSDLVSLMFHWIFSIAGAIHLIGIGVLAIAAIRLSPARSSTRFYLVALALWVVASALGALNTSTVRAVLAGAIWALTVIVVYAVPLGILVAKGKQPKAILATSAVLLAVQAPLSLLSGLYITCYVGHDCP